jgi:PPM family protein phosphatase
MRLIDIALATDPGRHRAENQDYADYQTIKQPAPAAPETLMVVADGMGGHAGGAVAAKMAVEVMMATYAQSGTKAEAITGRLRQAFVKANAVLMRRSDRDPDLKGMGTTLTAAVIRATKVCFAHVGDSRGYIFTKGRLTQFTTDHSLVADLVDKGIIQAEDAEHHPQANVITRAIGFKTGLIVDTNELPIAPEASFHLILCSDGLYKEVDDDTLAAVLSELPEPSEAANRLVSLANQHGGKDNVTVLVARASCLPKENEGD